MALGFISFTSLCQIWFQDPKHKTSRSKMTALFRVKILIYFNLILFRAMQQKGTSQILRLLLRQPFPEVFPESFCSYRPVVGSGLFAKDYPVRNFEHRNKIHQSNKLDCFVTHKLFFFSLVTLQLFSHLYLKSSS
jgi:hypothetical protein